MRKNHPIISVIATMLVLAAILAACGSTPKNTTKGTSEATKTAKAAIRTEATKTVEKSKPAEPIAVEDPNAVPLPANGIMEAEKATLSGVETNTSLSGYSGEGYVTGFDSDGDSVEFIVKLETDGLYSLSIRYAGEYGDKNNTVLVNGDSLGSIQFKEGNSFVDLPVGKVLLNKGANYIKIVKEWGWFDVDSIKLEKAEATAPLTISKNLINPNATKEAKALMSFLVDNFGKHIISGQQSGDNFDVYTIMGKTGKAPALRGFDLIEYSPTRVKYGAKGSDVDTAIEWWKKGGIVTFCWHWNAPKDLINTTEIPWWKGFYTEGTTFDAEAALKDKNSEGYKLIISDIDTIAIQLKKLQDANVPVLWRPLHEGDGAWFWWGAKGPKVHKELYKLMYDRLVNYHKINNLIWVYNAPKPEYYPGDEYVDIASCDIYAPGNNYGPNSSAFDNLVSITKGKKLIALAENGVIPDPDKLMKTQTNWSYFMTWGGEFVADEKYTSTEQWKKVYTHDYVLTLDELPDLKNYPVGN